MEVVQIDHILGLSFACGGEKQTQIRPAGAVYFLFQGVSLLREGFCFLNCLDSSNVEPSGRGSLTPKMNQSLRMSVCLCCLWREHK